MAINDLWLGLTGAELLLPAFGRKYSESQEEISRTQRAASGKLRRDIIATKKRFTIRYDDIKHEDLEQIATLYALETDLNLIVKRPDNTSDSYTVQLQPFDRERVKSVGCNWWGGVTIELREV